MDELKKTEFLTAAEVVTDFFNGKFHYQSVLRMTRQGKLPAVKIGKGYLYRRSELEKWAENNFATPCWSKIKI
ncbi:helix-turn-helix domain-containing protein [Megasphaera sueciensis]|uniref:helix-turn-helix domain-containing protein n=1 Tax=Megasphaera sueciensis TaxID=349094 RepID=UPI003D04CBC4